ncbi:MAG: aspartate aminotransferase family protein [Planctomycetota bacterium]|nr:MAG: aspartate aminotransferase family protein [Planctomycetota bacterium]
MDVHEFREAGHRAVDAMADYLAGIEERRVFPAVTPAEMEALFDAPLPRAGMPLAQVLEQVEARLMPNCTHVGHPGYLGLITPSPAPAGVLGDFIAAALNQNIGAYSIGPAAVSLERRVVRWLADLVGFGPEAGGHLTSGGMLANLTGLKLARDAVSGNRVQHEGVRGPSGVYVSEERHVSVDKSLDAIGLGRDSLRALPTDDAYQLRLDALEQAITQDRRRGVRPLAVVAMAGTTNTGSVDDLAAIRGICDRESLWMHVDAAYGGGMLLSRAHPGVLDGIERADSVTIDPHKWFYAPLDAGAILVRDGAQLTRSFGIKPPYLTDELDAAGERFQYYVHSLEQSRRLRGLKVWMSFQRYGSRQIGRWIDDNVAVARRLHDLAAASPDFRSATPPRMSGVCLRYECGLDERRSAALHARVAQRMETLGRFWFSTTVMKGVTFFRVNVVNFRTRPEHMDELFALLRAECVRAHDALAAARP